MYIMKYVFMPQQYLDEKNQKSSVVGISSLDVVGLYLLPGFLYRFNFQFVFTATLFHFLPSITPINPECE